ncbi:hypothetical protein THAOC_17406 [Thalassiosira oceanica]|uniref:Uncharacterized protein n=1 Tax=Thalassiosira oceanica TaxID=159749 RepID=K0S9P7_THAOC|nr:hypothetical protein THAOC_17406 [Thalassiosira oceanica]|eukprot:EJK62005.1 hypothetical protein THAOC_17406 [Thalassiosira oceanica]
MGIAVGTGIYLPVSRTDAHGRRGVVSAMLSVGDLAAIAALSAERRLFVSPAVRSKCRWPRPAAVGGLCGHLCHGSDEIYDFRSQQQRMKPQPLSSNSSFLNCAVFERKALDRHQAAAAGRQRSSTKSGIKSAGAPVRPPGRHGPPRPPRVRRVPGARRRHEPAPNADETQRPVVRARPAPAPPGAAARPPPAFGAVRPPPRAGARRAGAAPAAAAGEAGRLGLARAELQGRPLQVVGVGRDGGRRPQGLDQSQPRQAGSVQLPRQGFAPVLPDEDQQAQRPSVSQQRMPRLRLQARQAGHEHEQVEDHNVHNARLRAGDQVRLEVQRGQAQGVREAVHGRRAVQVQGHGPGAQDRRPTVRAEERGGVQLRTPGTRAAPHERAGGVPHDVRADHEDGRDGVRPGHGEGGLPRDAEGSAESEEEESRVALAVLAQYKE